MAKLESLHGLYVHELKDMYSAENQILKALIIINIFAREKQTRLSQLLQMI